MTEHAWLDPDEVTAALSGQAGVANAGVVESKRIAAATFVERVRPDLFVEGTFTPPADVVEGAKLLVARLYSRIGSPAGVASFGELGAASVRSFDPDVDRLLQLGPYRKPVIG